MYVIYFLSCCVMVTGYFRMGKRTHESCTKPVSRRAFICLFDTPDCRDGAGICVLNVSLRTEEPVQLTLECTTRWAVFYFDDTMCHPSALS